MTATRGPAPAGGGATSTQHRPIIRGGWGPQMAPVQKPKTFKASARRLLGRLAPERRLVVMVIAFAVVSTALTVSGPKILGRATDLIFVGSGMIRNAHIVAASGIKAGRGIDFAALADVLVLVMVVYAGASLFQWLPWRFASGLV